MNANCAKVVFVGSMLISGSSFAQMGPMGRGMMGGPLLRHRSAMMNGIGPYAYMTNPLQDTKEQIAEGRKLYEQNCASCHGPAGYGDGPAGKGLVPPPTNIAATTKTRIASDGFLFWSIAEGGLPIGTPMPSFGQTLKPNEIWAIVTYIRRF